MRLVNIVKFILKLSNKEERYFSHHLAMRPEYFLELKHFYLLKFKKHRDEFYLQKAKECEEMYRRYKNMCVL